MEMNDKILQEILDKIKDKINPILKEYDLKAKKTNISYDEIGFSLKFDIERTDVNVAEIRLNEFAELNGYEPLYGKMMHYAGKHLQLVDYNSKARKWKIIAKDLSNDKMVGIPLEAINGFSYVVKAIIKDINENKKD